MNKVFPPVGINGFHRSSTLFDFFILFSQDMNNCKNRSENRKIFNPEDIINNTKMKLHVYYVKPGPPSSCNCVPTQ